VSGSTSRASLSAARSIEAKPRSRRSTIEISPTTAVMASTWKDSTEGNKSSFSRISVASAVASSHFRTSFI